MRSRILQKYLPAGILLLVLWLGTRYLLPLARPFLLAAVLALCAEPLVRLLEKRLPRGAAAGIGISIALLLTALLVVMLCAVLLREIKKLAAIMPGLEDTAVSGIASLESFFLSLADSAPDSVRPLLSKGVENLFSSSSQVLDQVNSRLLTLASGVLKGLPDSALSLGTWVLASYMISVRLPRIREFFQKQPAGIWQQRLLPGLKQLRRSLAGWLSAQIKLVAITFCVLTLGFLLLQIPYAPLWAGLISLADALPVLGTGTVLVPWSFIRLLQGDTLQAVGLMGIYAVAALLRSVLEPRFIGRQLGLDPLITLMALYAGYHIWGILGMLTAPLLAMALTQLLRRPEPA